MNTRKTKYKLDLQQN